STATSVAVGLVQGNIRPGVGADPVARASSVRIHSELTRRAAPDVQLLIWPEAALTVDRASEPRILAELASLAATVRRPLLVGRTDAGPDPAGHVAAGPSSREESPYVNSALLVTATGVQARYDKIHLVPFGEYRSLKRLLSFAEAA